MKNMNRFLLSISACLMIALTHASVEDQSVESRILKQLRVRQQELPSEIAQSVQNLATTPEQVAQENNATKEQLEQLKDPIVINFANVEMKLDVAKKKAELLSVNEQITLLTKKEPAAKFAQLKELLEKRDRLETKINAFFTSEVKEDKKQEQISNWRKNNAELKTVNQQIMQLTTPAGTMPALEAAEKEEIAASEAFFSRLFEKAEPVFKEAFEKNQQQQEK